MQQHRYTDIPQTNYKPSGRYAGTQTQDSINETTTGNQLAHGSYGALLFDPRWKAKRTEIITRDNYCCIICKGKEELLVHHRQYLFVKVENAFKVPWDYPSNLLITLCKSCHQRGHSKFKVPTVII